MALAPGRASRIHSAMPAVSGGRVLVKLIGNATTEEKGIVGASEGICET